MIRKSELDEIPYLKALTSSRWQPSPVFQRCYRLMPSKEWNKDLTLLTELLFFLKSEEGHYRLPREWRRTFSLIRLADMLGVDTFLQAVCKETLIPVQMLDNSNSIRDVRTRLRTAYRLSEHLAAKVHKGACGTCSNPLPEIPPRRAKLYRMPCCEQVVHAHCWADKRVCAACCTGLVPLPCVVCNRPLECWGGDTLEMYIFSEESRFLCCGADAHQLCRMQFLAKRWPKCPACQCYLEPNRKLHIDFCGAGDYIFARRERRHDLRRRMGKDYSYIPRL